VLDYIISYAFFLHTLRKTTFGYTYSTWILGTLANLCVESHLQVSTEQGLCNCCKDATTRTGPEAIWAAYTNYGFITTAMVEMVKLPEVYSSGTNPFE
jgi:hypothetical protein